VLEGAYQASGRRQCSRCVLDAPGLDPETRHCALMPLLASDDAAGETAEQGIARKH
jgi:hypothetical protein